MGTLRFFEEVVSFKIRRTFGFADYSFRGAEQGGSSFFTLRRGSGSARAAVAGEKRRCVYRTAAFFVIFG